MVQRAVVMLLEASYEQDFYDGSYGCRPGRSPHQALHELRERCMTEGSGWIVDADVRGYFDSIDRTRLREVLRQRVKDGRILRLMGQWLRAGVREAGVLHHPDTGVVQGGTISPVLANIFGRLFGRKRYCSSNATVNWWEFTSSLWRSQRSSTLRMVSIQRTARPVRGTPTRKKQACWRSSEGQAG
jgi:retron-type reverse transcriptase